MYFLKFPLIFLFKNRSTRGIVTMIPQILKVPNPLQNKKTFMVIFPLDQYLTLTVINESEIGKLN